MKKLNKKNNVNNMTVEAFAIYCMCTCRCGCVGQSALGNSYFAIDSTSIYNAINSGGSYMEYWERVF